MIYGQIPPQAKDIEEALLGTMLLDRHCIDEVSNYLQRPECFYVEAHQQIFQAILQLYRSGQPIDTLTVSEQLTKMGELEKVGGSYYVAQLTNRVVSSANNGHYCKIILQKFMAREMIRICGDAVSQAYTNATDIFELMEHVEQSVSDISVQHIHGEMLPMDAAIVKTVQQIAEWRNNQNEFTGVSSGYPALDKATLGFQPGELIIVAARPGEGKTALALNLVMNAAKSGVVVGMWSLEMQAVRLCLRMLSSMSGIGLYHLRSGRITDEEMKGFYLKGVQPISSYKIFFDDKAGATIHQVKAKARRLVRKHKAGLIVVDYLQLMKGEGFNREQQISGISRELKELALELNVPIIALSQLSRDVEKRSTATRLPQLSDLRESGAIEQDADMVLFIYKPTEAEIAEDASLMNRRYLRIAKQRDGLTMTFDADFIGERQLFENIRTQGTTPIPAPGKWRPVPISSEDPF